MAKTAQIYSACRWEIALCCKIIGTVCLRCPVKTVNLIRCHVRRLETILNSVYCGIGTAELITACKMAKTATCCYRVGELGFTTEILISIPLQQDISYPSAPSRVRRCVVAEVLKAYGEPWNIAF